ncbi:hypothetical protein CEE34_02915 [Candidatus Aerophobetes bacterium Ae_b3a]|nr:MAG: hypothetical protein CEE34_02915 [Candidatus Aerophobetes bacterium Ae_b3a]
MSTTRNSFRIFNAFSNEFIKKFDFYLDSFDELFHLQGEIGLDQNELSSLPELDQNLVKAYLFLAESSNTTAIGTLRLLSSNLYSDAYSLVRILYEIACLMHYGNMSRTNKEELYFSMFKSNLPEEEHYKNEWKLIKKAENQYESECPGFIAVRRELNNFGGHISRRKVVSGNITSIGESSASRLFSYNFNNRYLLAGLEFVHNTFNIILEEYAKHLKEFNGVTNEAYDDIMKFASNFLDNIRPKLQNFIDPNIP